jgi:glutathione S-transferase
MKGSPMRVQVFGSRVSPFVEKVVRALALKRVDYTLVDVRSPLDFKRWNPQTGKMPVLDVDGERTWDSTFILRELDALVPEPPLFAAEPEVAARQRFLEDWSDEALYWYGMALRWSDANADATIAQVLGSIPVPAFLHPLIAPIFRRRIGAQPRAQGLGRLPLDVLVAELGRRLDELVLQLGDRPFFFADRPGAADLALFGQLTMLQSGPTPQAAELVAARPELNAHHARVDAATAAAGGASRTAPPTQRYGDTRG